MKNYIKMFLVLIASALMMQGFQCASREVTTAKVAMQNRDYAKAIDFLKQELVKVPTNAEAWILLTDAYYATEDIDNAAETYKKAKDVVSLPADKEKLARLRNFIWVALFNRGYEQQSKYVSTKEQKHLNDALASFQKGAEVMPLMVDFYIAIANVYDILVNPEKANEFYLKYLEMTKTETDFLASNQLYLNMFREDFLSKLGKPLNSIDGTQTGSNETEKIPTKTDVFKAGEKIVILFSEKKDKDYQLVGIRANPSPDWLPNEQTAFTRYLTQPLGALAAYYYEKKDLNNSLKYIKMLSSLEPLNSDANTSMVQLYIEMGKQNEAIEEIKKLTQKDPNNKVFWGQYGDLFMNLGNFDAAIEQYEKALAIDPNYDFVVRNIASVYKNKASKMQQEQQDKKDKDKNYKEDFGAYEPLLKKSAMYFEKSLKTERFQDDFEVYSELVNIYMVLKMDKERDEALEGLELIQSSLKEEQKANYYLRMMKIYGDLKMNDKMNAAKEKYDSLSK